MDCGKSWCSGFGFVSVRLTKLELPFHSFFTLRSASREICVIFEKRKVNSCYCALTFGVIRPEGSVAELVSGQLATP